MNQFRWAVAIVIVVTFGVPAPAQFFPPPIVPVVGVPVLVPNGIDFQYKTRRLSINGFFGNGTYTPGILPIAATGGMPLVPGQQLYLYTPGYFPQNYYPFGYPFGAQTSTITLQIINPPGVAGVRRALGDDYDINGIDLDVEPAAKIWNRNAPPLRVKVAQELLADRNAPAARVLAPAAERDVETNVVPSPGKADANVVKASAIEKPRAAAIRPEQPSIDLGTKSFAAGEYGLAIVRFQKAAAEDVPRAKFLQAHTCLAVGKYLEAVELIQQGMKRDPAWPQSGFRPKAELYGNDEPRWSQHVNRLEQARRQQPKNADYVFLLGYLAWFDGDRAAAVGHFQQARTLALDPRWEEAFLKAAQAP